MWSTPTVTLLAQASDAAKFYYTIRETFDADAQPYGSPGGANQEPPL